MISVKRFNRDYIARKNKTVKFDVEELPELPTYFFRSKKDRIKYIKDVESKIRSSLEYKDYIYLIKKNLDLNSCLIFKNIKKTESKSYSIELHHTPFTLFDLVDIVINKFEAFEMDLNPFMVAEEVMRLHYEGRVGLVPLSKTVHELVGAGQIFIPLSYVYEDYSSFCKEYYDFISPVVEEKILAIMDLSDKCDTIQSDVLDVEFTYVEIDGIELPKIPAEWQNVMLSQEELIKESDSLENISTSTE